jgi:hypothetical protein
LEVQRLSNTNGCNIEPADSDLDFNVNEEDNEFENLTLSHLSGDLMEEVMDDDSDHLSCDCCLQENKNKSRAVSYKKKSAKIRIVKKYRNGSKMKYIFWNSRCLTDFWLNLDSFQIHVENRS